MKKADQITKLKINIYLTFNNKLLKIIFVH